MLKFTLFRIPVSVQWWFFLLAAFLGGALYANTGEAMLRVLVAVGAIFVSILIHELGHALTGLKLGAQRVEIALHGMGGHAAFPGARFSRGSRILMTAAGPGASILLAVAFSAVAVFGYGDNADFYFRETLTGHFVWWMIRANIIWTLFNLCPLLPLDGGQILNDVLGPKRLKLTCIIGFVTLAVLGFVLVVQTRSVFNLVILFFLGNYNWQVFRSIK